MEIYRQIISACCHRSIEHRHIRLGKYLNARVGNYLKHEAYKSFFSNSKKKITISMHIIAKEDTWGCYKQTHKTEFKKKTSKKS